MPLRNKILWEGGIFASIPKSEYSLSNESVDYGIMIKERKKHVKKRKNLSIGIYRVCGGICHSPGSECNAYYGRVSSG